MRAESGICNVCSAPCSSCLHIGRAFMRSKTDEFSDESSQGNGGSQCSVNGASHFKGAARQCRRNNSSETSNLLNISFNHDSLSKNAERKASLRTFDVPGASKDDVMHQTCVSAGDAQLALKRKYIYDQRALSNKLEEQKFHGSHDYSASCVSISNEEAASDMVCGNRSAETCGRADDCSLVGDNTAASIKVCLNMEIETDKHSGYAEAVNSSEQLEEIEKVKESCRLTAANETSLQSLPEDDSDGSDTVEHDVKVCDICGDAGREDLLAICSRCSDGAEHTYCMREMMEKVPEGDWLCEECKFDEEVRSLKQDVTVDEHDKNQSFGLASTLNTNLVGKLNNKDSGIDGNKMNKDILNAKASIKKHGENIEMNSALKRPAVDPTVCSPNTSSSSRVAAFSRDLSFRNLNKGKVKPAHHHLSSGTCSKDDSSEAASSSTDPRLQAPRGALVKSNSFSFTNAKPRVKLVDDVVPQKQKSTREHAFLDIKEGGVKFIGKSMSFKSVNLGRLNPAESKLRMPLVKSPTQELKGLKQGREGDLLERKDSFKSERSLVSSALGNTTVSMLKGEVKRKSSSLSVAGASSTRGDSSSVEQKPDQNNLMYEPLSSTFTADRPFSNASEYPPEALSRPRELANPCERIGESSENHIQPTVTAGGRSDAFKRSKETGCSTQSCTAEDPQSLLGDVPAARSSEPMNKDNQLKAAIEAAMLKKPGIYRKNKKPNQNDELNMSSTNLNCDVRPQDQLSTPINTRSIFATDELHEGQRVLWNFTAESCKQTTVSNVKQFSALSSKAGTLKAGDISSIDPYDVKPFRGDLPSHAPAASVLYKMSTVPEHEYIWHGGFLVQRSGKLPELHHGIQAHLSTCASPKVLEVVNKFPSNILLNEVSRMSTWPVQFQEVGAKEDNIALYFFAKDLESYEKDYKTLLETMVVNDLALKGNFDGVELLIFPSNHLPEKSQRWNMLYFLWGVFRGKKVNHMQDVSSPQKCRIPRTLPNAIMPLPESTCSLGPIDGDLATCSKSSIVSLLSKCPASVEPSCLSSGIQNGHCDTNASSLDAKRQCVQTNAGGQDSIFDATSLPRTGVASTLFQETRSTRTPLGVNGLAENNEDENGDTDCKLDKKLVQPAGTISGSKKSGNYFPICLDNGRDSNQVSSCSSEIPPSVSCSRDQETFERTWKELEGSLDAKPLLQNNHGKRLHEDSPWPVSQAAAGIDNTLLDGGCATKKQKTCYSGLHGDNNFRNVSSSTDFLVPGIHDVRSGSTVKAKRGEEALVEREVSRNSGIAERYLFTVDPHAVHNFSSGDKLVPLEVLSPDDDYDDDELPAEGVPNLELALGAEMKPSKQGILPPFLLGKVELRASDPDQPPEISASKEDRDDLSACLSLSLSFPFPVDEQTVKPVLEVEQLLPDRRHVNPSLRFFEGSSDK